MSEGWPTIMQYIPAGRIRGLVSQLDSTEFSVDIYKQTGVFVVRKAIPARWIGAWQEAWREFYAESLAADRNVNPFNPVVVNEAVPPVLAAIHRCPDLLDIMERIYPDLGLYMQRFLLKDRKSRTPVFLHHDFGYDCGWPEKTAAFIPLSPTDADNGSLVFYPGTHLFGYLGDVGEFDPDIIDPDWPAICPALEPGDIALMHECTWHASPPYVHGPDRVLVQVTYQPANDPSSAALLRGNWRTEFRFGELREKFFKRSRASRLRELQAEVDRLNPHFRSER
jgi:Phytanoyl-CoA dioxygenase (PhyH)